ncbi:MULTISPECIES: DUF86 domain-containing protein [Mesobacillus]|uniref:DUF86 domain-containing protein n=2 Tax=Mesobacillus TaxID=2675231 RepID=A0A0D6ZFA8_9BACI|nr:MULTISPECIES: DUF86 domain-containing protein [Mesobacillus]KIY23298.1 hypothetical protein UB32_03730 [Mesobacillus subterraneus]MDQ0412665.1 uncharacterized protein YutE (UPF0331/DUF86 family) [Mesobacillus stamsii]
MYFVDRDQIEQTLEFLDGQIEFFEGNKSWETPMEKAALERVAHTMVEAILDVGNAMIDGFIMRDPGSYEDIIDILDDEKVVTLEISAGLKKMVLFRKMLVQQYTAVDHASLIQTFQSELPQLKLYSKKVREYLTNELGPVSAFKK